MVEQRQQHRRRRMPSPGARGGAAALTHTGPNPLAHVQLCICISLHSCVDLTSYLLFDIHCWFLSSLIQGVVQSIFHSPTCHLVQYSWLCYKKYLPSEHIGICCVLCHSVELTHPPSLQYHLITMMRSVIGVSTLP